MPSATARANQHIASPVSNNLARLLSVFAADFEHRMLAALKERGHPEVRPPHQTIIANLGFGAVRVTELAERARVTQQAMGKTLKELERLGYVARDVDALDRRAREIRLTLRGAELARDMQAITRELRQHYATKIGEVELNQLEQTLREALEKLKLGYLPEGWARADQSSP